MARAFTMAKVTELAKPEVAVAGVVVGHLIARTIDAKLGWNRPFRRVSDLAHIGILLGSAYCVATDRAPEISSAVFFANSGIVATILGDQLYEKYAPSITARGGRGGSVLDQAEAVALKAQLKAANAKVNALLGAGNPGLRVNVGAAVADEQILT